MINRRIGALTALAAAAVLSVVVAPLASAAPSTINRTPQTINTAPLTINGTAQTINLAPQTIN